VGVSSAVKNMTMETKNTVAIHHQTTIDEDAMYREGLSFDDSDLQSV
jgi:hypothetical protein